MADVEMDFTPNPAQNMKEMNEECVRLLKQETLDKDGWKALYEKDFQRYMAKVPPLSWRLEERNVPYRFQLFLDEVKEGDKVLEVGCGDGYFLNLAHKKGAKCSGLDVSTEAIITAGKFNQDIGFTQGFAEELPYDNGSFDVVICSQVLEHVKDPEIVVGEMFRVCKPGGKVVITVPIKMNLLDPLHMRFFDYYKTGERIVGLMELMEKFTSKYTIRETYKFDMEKDGQKIFYVRCLK